VAEIKESIKDSYPKIKAPMEWLQGDMTNADAVFATGWETAYPVFNDPGGAHKFYFVQDFEPYFYPLGSEYILAENTYKFGFHGITAGGWLSQKLSEYGMKSDHYDFGADTELYKFSNSAPRKEIFFYARPVTPRRGFELGIMALQIFHEKMPDYIINLAGWDVSDYEIPFPYQNLKTMALSELSEVYNRCAAALVISLTNMSLLPLELLAAGTIPVVTEGSNNRLVSDNPYIKFAPASPDSLAEALVQTLKQKDLPAIAKKASQSVGGLDWEDAGKRLEAVLRRKLNG
jgi:O-antigen biosynthesis protein